MLIEFSVKNFKSIKEKQTLNMEATSDTSLDYNLIEYKDQANKKYRLLKSSVLYGANASGKSNVLESLMVLRQLVKKSHENQKGDKLRRDPYRFKEEYLSRPTKFDIVFIYENIKYNYGLVYDEEKVIEEYLYYYPKGRKSQIFERKSTDKFKFNKDKKEQNMIKERTRDNVLYLSSSTQFNYEKTTKAFDWFNEKLQGIGPGDYTRLTEYTLNNLKKNNKFKNKIQRALKIADFGITDITGKTEKISVDEIEDLPINVKELGLTKDGELESLEINTIHELEKVEGSLPLFKESEGTQRFFSVIGPIITALQNGEVLIIDELDTKLHHMLNKFIIELFHDPEENPNGAQLIFTTHNTNLLDQDLFRRDQIWFTERNPKTAATDLYSLVEYSPRKDKDIEKGYLVGRYGGIPFISNKKILKEGS